MNLPILSDLGLPALYGAVPRKASVALVDKGDIGRLLEDQLEGFM